MMINANDQQINFYIRKLDDENQAIRIDAITQLGEIGDELCLKELRERLKYFSKEYQALILAIGKLKKILDVK